MSTNPFTTNRITETTTRLAPPPVATPWRAPRWYDPLLDWLSRRDPLAVIGLLIVIPLVAIIVARPAERRATQPIIILGTPTAAAAVEQPAAVAPTAALARQVVAFDAPNGTALGPIPAPTDFTGRDTTGAWLATPWDGHDVWVRRSDLNIEGDVMVFENLTQPTAQPAPAPPGPALMSAPAAAPPVGAEQPPEPTAANPWEGTTWCGALPCHDEQAATDDDAAQRRAERDQERAVWHPPLVEGESDEPCGGPDVAPPLCRP